MSFVISSVLPFPSITWWAFVVQAESICWDLAEHFEKMTYRNRYYLATANGLLKLSIPLQKGRDQRALMKDVIISYDENWQMQHWRTIVSAYNRSAYFEHYSHSLEKLFSNPYSSLVEYNLSSVHWLMKQIGLQVNDETTEIYKKNYPDDVTDLRTIKPQKDGIGAKGFPEYYQLFQERNGFLPDLSLLDLLFTEGPHTLKWIRERQDGLKNWNK
jgi:hypothetical protein